MSTTPVPAPTPNLESTITNKITTDLAWFKTHIALLVIVAVLVAGSVYGIESLLAKHDAANTAKDQQLLTAVTGQTNDLKARMTQDEQSSALRDAQYSQIITQLSATISKQTAQLQQQIKVNSTLSAAQTAQAISQKVGAPQGAVITQGDNVVTNLDTSRTINSDLDTLATTKQQLAEKSTQFDDQVKLTNDAVQNETDAKAVLASQETQLQDEQKACTDQIKTVKAEGRKSKLKWFLAGVITGVIGGHFAGF